MAFRSYAPAGLLRGLRSGVGGEVPDHHLLPARGRDRAVREGRGERSRLQVL